MKKKLNKVFLFLSFVMIFKFYSCANQLPPSGGVEDRTPPKIIESFPSENAINVRGNTITIEFDEYIDRKSFIESFEIYPKINGDMTFNWSGKSVKIEFEQRFTANRTYSVILNSSLSDRFGNKITNPYTFAFSTGSQIDKGIISGKIFSKDNNKVIIAAYVINNALQDTLNPIQHLPDYRVFASSEGDYSFSNLPKGLYRIFAFIDNNDDRRFTPDFDEIKISSKDYLLENNTSEIKNLNFLFYKFEPKYSSKGFLNSLNPDSIDFIYSSVRNNSSLVPNNYIFYFYFKNNIVSKSQISNNMTLTDSISGKKYLLVFNWLSDSLLQVFSTDDLADNTQLKFSLDLTSTSKKYLYSLSFKTAAKDDYGKISGKINFTIENSSYPIGIYLINVNNIFLNYFLKVNSIDTFQFDKVLKGEYLLFSYVDENGNSLYDEGQIYPFRKSEKYFIYGNLIRIKGLDRAEGILVNF